MTACLCCNGVIQCDGDSSRKAIKIIIWSGASRWPCRDRLGPCVTSPLSRPQMEAAEEWLSRRADRTGPDVLSPVGLRESMLELFSASSVRCVQSCSPRIEQCPCKADKRSPCPRGPNRRNQVHPCCSEISCFPVRPKWLEKSHSLGEDGSKYRTGNIPGTSFSRSSVGAIFLKDSEARALPRILLDVTAELKGFQFTKYVVFVRRPSPQER